MLFDSLMVFAPERAELRFNPLRLADREKLRAPFQRGRGLPAAGTRKERPRLASQADSQVWLGVGANLKRLLGPPGDGPRALEPPGRAYLLEDTPDGL